MKKPFHYGAEEKTFEAAKKLRKEMTPSEKILWKLLRSRSFDGFKFRRQHPIARYISDFYCHEKKLVIELDGRIHNTQESIEYDKKRTEIINENKIEILRIKNEDVLDNIEKIKRTIKEKLELLK